jgi:hypothetical protein
MVTTSRLIVAFMPAFPCCGDVRRAIVCLGRGQTAAGSSTTSLADGNLACIARQINRLSGLARCHKFRRNPL